MKHKWWFAVIALGVVATFFVTHPGFLVASDHDDGETELKGRNVNLTDLYAFREIDQNPSAGVPEGDLVLVMNTNPRSVARQQYYFSARARYTFHITRVANNNDAATGKEDVSLTFHFSEPAANQQQVRITAVRDGEEAVAKFTTGGQPIMTTSINATPAINRVRLFGHTLDVYAGLREDPFFFDVEQYFRVRAGALGIGPAVGFRTPGVDFTAGYNVNSIIVRVPRAFLQSVGEGSKKVDTATTFDIWETIRVGRTQTDRLARPAINEGLIVTNAFLVALDSIGPDCEADALAGREPCASAAAPIVAEAIATLRAFGNSPARALALIGAFLPDVMRIDTTQPSGYGNALNSRGSPIRGRKLLDDAIDITLQVVTGNPAASDNTNYSTAPHHPLLPSFPYLAAPN